MLRQLIHNKVVPVLPPKPVPTELERLLQRLLEEVQAPKHRNWNYRHGGFVTKPASGDTGSGLVDATGSHTLGLGNGGVFLLWQGGTWCESMSQTVTGMDGR